MKKFLQEFKNFALKSNVMALAVGIIIGGAFQGVVSSLTENILSPILGLFVGSNFDILVLDIFSVSIRYGAFITSVVNFIILAFIVFLMVKGMNKLAFIGKKETGASLPARTCPYCKTELHEEATRCPACTSQLPLNV